MPRGLSDFGRRNLLLHAFRQSDNSASAFVHTMPPALLSGHHSSYFNPMHPFGWILINFEFPMIFMTTARI
jgi:hypothetical protein